MHRDSASHWAELGSTGIRDSGAFDRAARTGRGGGGRVEVRKWIRVELGRAFAATLAVCCAAAVACAVASPAPATRAAGYEQKLEFFSVLTRRQFVNNADDRARGEGHNPFGNPSSAAPPPENEKLFGPFAGDTGLYAFALYSDRHHRSRAGSVIFVCQYGFNESSFCSASFSLHGGSLIANGAAAFESKTFALGIVGGTSHYRGATGSIDVVALGPATQLQPVSRLDPMLQSQRLTVALGSGRPTPTRTLVRYSNATTATFIGNDDDEARGDVNNPIGRHEGARAAKAHASGGPFPGDAALFGFDLFSDASLDSRAGSGVYTCQYDFARGAFCQATIKLDGGTLSVAGTIPYGVEDWTIAVTGGTGNYAGLAGELEARRSGNRAQRLVFRLGFTRVVRK